MAPRDRKAEEELRELLRERNLPLLARRYPDGPLVVMCGNEGGGTRKTTDGVNLAVSLAEAGYETAVLDGDQTMAASCYLGYGVTNKKLYPDRVDAVYSRLASLPNVYDVLHARASLKEAMLPARTRIIEPSPDPDCDEDHAFKVIPNLHIILGSREMSQASDDLRSLRKPQATDAWIRRSIAELPTGTLDVLVIDSRGTFDTLEMSELFGADYVIGCVKPDSKDDDTLAGLTAFIEQGRQTYQFSGGSADLRFILINGEQQKNRGLFYSEIVTELADFYGDRVLPVIPEAVQIAESVRAQEPLQYWSPGHPALDRFNKAAMVIAKDGGLPGFSPKRWPSRPA